MARPKKTIVAPMISIEGDVHPLEDMEASGEMPTLTSIGYSRVSPTSREYVSYIITSRGGEVLKLEVAEPNLRAISEDEAKTSFVTHFMSGDL